MKEKEKKGRGGGEYLCMIELRCLNAKFFMNHDDLRPKKKPGRGGNEHHLYSSKLLLT
jgi:hypothetical protein